jgi:hypothetical protein
MTVPEVAIRPMHPVEAMDETRNIAISIAVVLFRITLFLLVGIQKLREH